ncbi:XRE family transcriptional regulator [Kitasatospora sp. NPDC002227]|uniref:helix-turn-helix domain-containing protein n=1 Tax=Kitasatospora sp. NPDC002227 TaxID=3154773 RepID=UPI003331AD92
MRRRPLPPATPTPVPFSPAAARAHRAGLGLTPGQVAEGMAAHGVRLLPGHVLGWENGELRPSEEEFVALARALWCPPAQLMGAAPATLRDFRVAREYTQEQAAQRLGLSLAAYAKAETIGRWSGDEEQTHTLAHVLGIGLRSLVRVTGRQDEFEQCLRSSIDGRWQAQLGPLARLVPAPRSALTAVLTALQSEYQVPLSWGTPAAAPTTPLPDRFWQLLAGHDTDIPV